MVRRDKVRHDGEGAVFLDEKTGLWNAALRLDDGKKKRWRSKDRAVVVARLEEARQTLRKGGTIRADERLTLGDWLDEWLVIVKPSLEYSSWWDYQSKLSRYLPEKLKRTRLTGVTAQMLDRLFASLATERGLSPSTIQKTRSILHAAFSAAAKRDLILRNVVDLTDPPKVRRYEAQVLTPDQTRTLIEHAWGTDDAPDRYGALWIMAVTSGMRTSELLALHWSDLDPKAKTATVRRAVKKTADGPQILEPKTRGSRRQIALLDITVEALQKHRAQQNPQRLKMGADWRNPDLVFATSRGGILSRSDLSNRYWPQLLRRAGLPKVRFYDTRHTAATLHLMIGTDIKEVSAMLGHNGSTITRDVYQHVLPTMLRASADRLNALLSAQR